jgi:hypothetical protein
MEAVFIELPAFERHREEYLSDDDFKTLQKALLTTPKAGAVIEGTGGLRKVRFGDRRRGKGSRGGIRIIYYWWIGGAQFWLFTLYDKNEMTDLSPQQKKILKELLDREIDTREKR